MPSFDPPRHDSAETIRRALNLRVYVKMITGNNEIPMIEQKTKFGNLLFIICIKRYISGLEDMMFYSFLFVSFVSELAVYMQLILISGLANIR